MNTRAILLALGALALLYARSVRQPSSSAASTLSTNAYERTRNQSVVVDGSGTTWRQTAGEAPRADKLSIAAGKVTFHALAPKDQPKGSFGGTDALPTAKVPQPDPVRALVNYFTPDNAGAEPL